MTKKKSLRSITKFHSDDIDYNITRRNYELVIGWLVGWLVGWSFLRVTGSQLLTCDLTGLILSSDSPKSNVNSF